MTEQAALREVQADSSEGAFRPIQYMGSKARLLTRIDEAFETVDPTCGPALDLFSGSGIVAAHLSRRRPVTAVDVQEYARVLASALMKPARPTSGQIERLVAEARRNAVDLAGTRLGGLLRVERAANETLACGGAEPLAEIIERMSGSPWNFDGDPHLTITP